MKKKKAAPAPPPRSHNVVAPVPSPRTVQEIKKIEDEPKYSVIKRNLQSKFQNREDRAMSAPVESPLSSPASSLGK